MRSLLAVAWLGIAGTAGAQTCAPATHSEKLGDGTIVYNSIGTGPAVLLIHGLFADKEQLSPLACLLAAAGYTAIAPDLPGYGKSTGFPLGDYRLEREAEALHALTVRLGLEQLDVMGNSMGGAIAALYATAYPQQVRSLAFLGSPLGITPWAQGIRDAIYGGTNPFIPVTEAELDLELRLLFVKPPDIPPAEKKSIVENYVRHLSHYVQVWNIVNLYDDVLAQARPAQKPALIVWGESDRVFDVAAARRLQQRYRGSELHLLANAGHLLPFEDAAEVAPIYVNFLKTATDSRTITAAFACNAGKTVAATFTNGVHASVKLSLSDGRNLALPQAMAASGARYANEDESFVFWNKGNTAFIEEKGKTTYDGCVVRH
jgi:pimeloyl-ACP methyl ester carboxylesterase